MAAATDPDHVARHDAESLRRFRAARAAGDVAGARHHWERLLTDNFDRVRNMVDAESWDHLSRDERDDAVQKALIKISNNMIDTFRGTSVGEWVEATRTLVRHICIDVQRAAARVHKHEASLGETWSGSDDERGRHDSDVFKAIERRRRFEAEATADAERLEERGDFLDWAVQQLSPKRRAVIELSRQEVPVPEMQERLEMSRDALYQSRHRAIEDLCKLRDEYETPG